MINTKLEPGAEVCFLDDRNFVRRGELLGISGSVAALSVAQTFAQVPLVRCFTREADAHRKRVEVLTAEIAARQLALAETFKALAALSETVASEVDGVGCCAPCLCNCSGAGCCQS